MSDSKQTTSRYPADMDRECIALCDFINAQPGLATWESCCGHGRGPFRIFFGADDLASLRVIAEPLSTGTAWGLSVGWANGGERIYFCLEGPANPEVGDGFASWLLEQTA